MKNIKLKNKHKTVEIVKINNIKENLKDIVKNIKLK